MGRACALLLALLGLLQFVKAQYNDTAAFKVPSNFAAGRKLSDRPIYQIGTELEVQWETTQDEYRIILCHIWNDTDVSWTRGSTLYSKAKSLTEQGGFNWTVDPQSFDIEKYGFFMLFQPLDGTSPSNISAGTQYFNLTTEAVATKSTSATATLSSTPSTGTPTLDPTPIEQSPTSSSTGQTSAAASSSGGLSSGSVIGLGVGLGLGCAILLGAAVFFWLRGRKRKQQYTQADMGHGAACMAGSPSYQDNIPHGFAHHQDNKPPMASYTNQTYAPPTELQAPVNGFGGSDASTYGSPQQVYEMPERGTHGR